jgi:hypothetical protein
VAGGTLQRRLDGKIDRIGETFIVNDPGRNSQASRPLAAAATAVDALLDWLEAQPIFASVTAADSASCRHATFRTRAASEQSRRTRPFDDSETRSRSRDFA